MNKMFPKNIQAKKEDGIPPTHPEKQNLDEQNLPRNISKEKKNLEIPQNKSQRKRRRLDTIVDSLRFEILLRSSKQKYFPVTFIGGGLFR